MLAQVLTSPRTFGAFTRLPQTPTEIGNPQSHSSALSAKKRLSVLAGMDCQVPVYQGRAGLVLGHQD